MRVESAPVEHDGVADAAPHAADLIQDVVVGQAVPDGKAGRQHDGAQPERGGGKIRRIGEPGAGALENGRRNQKREKHQMQQRTPLGAHEGGNRLGGPRAHEQHDKAAVFPVPARGPEQDGEADRQEAEPIGEREHRGPGMQSIRGLLGPGQIQKSRSGEKRRAEKQVKGREEPAAGCGAAQQEQAAQAEQHHPERKGMKDRAEIQRQISGEDAPAGPARRFADLQHVAVSARAGKCIEQDRQR